MLAFTVYDLRLPRGHHAFTETKCQKDHRRCVQGAWKKPGAEVVNYVIINVIQWSLRMIHFHYDAAARQTSVSGHRLKSVNLSILKLQMKGQQMATVETAQATRPSIRFISWKWKMTQVDCVCVCAQTSMDSIKKNPQQLTSRGIYDGLVLKDSSKALNEKHFTRPLLFLLLISSSVEWNQEKYEQVAKQAPAMYVRLWEKARKHRVSQRVFLWQTSLPSSEYQQC